MLHFQHAICGTETSLTHEIIFTYLIYLAWLLVYPTVRVSSSTADIGGQRFTYPAMWKIVRTGKPISCATVYIADLKLGAIADASGHYHFNNLPSGTYLVEVHAIGYSSQLPEM